MLLKRSKKKKRGFFARLTRSFIAVVILTALVLGVSLFAKSAATMSTSDFAHFLSPVLSRLGLSENQAGTVAGEFVQRVEETGIGNDNLQKGKITVAQPINPEDPAINTKDETSNATKTNTGEKILSVAIMTDSGDESENLGKAVNKAKSLNVDYVFHLGDLTAWGDKQSLVEAKSVLDDSGLPWVAIPGDHDLAESVKLYGNLGLENFTEVFGKTYYAIDVNGIKFVIFDNSANNTPMDDTRFTWALENIKKADYVLVSQPIYHPSPTDIMSIMGVVDGEDVPVLKEQADLLLTAIRSSSVKSVFAGDHHMSSINKDPVRPTLTHYVTGAVAKSRNVQSFPRFYLLEIFTDGSQNVTEILF